MLLQAKVKRGYLHSRVIYIYLQDKIRYSSSSAYARMKQDTCIYNVFGHNI